MSREAAEAVARRENERVVRVVCDAPSHREITVANYRRLHDGDPKYDRSVWVWDQAMAQGGSRIETQGGLRARESIDRRDVTAKEAAEGRTWAEADAKRVVRDLDRTSDQLQCAKCGLSLTINRENLEKRLDELVAAGVSRLGFPALVAIVTKH